MVEVGDIVLYYGVHAATVGPFAAIVSKVHTEEQPSRLPAPARGVVPGYVKPAYTLVNLCVFEADGKTMNKQRVSFVAEGENVPSVPYCREKVNTPIMAMIE